MTGYRLEYQETSSSTAMNPEGDPVQQEDRLSYTLTGLLSFTRYRVSVQAVCNGEMGPVMEQEVMTMDTGKGWAGC